MIFLFILVNMGPCGRANPNDIFHDNIQQIYSEKFMHRPEDGLNQDVKRIVKFEILDFWQVVFLFVNMTYPLKSTQIKAPKFMYAPRVGFCQSC